MHDWQDLFAPHILDRGWNYYKSGEIKNLLIEDAICYADVTGTVDYLVKIDLTFADDPYCSCPHATDGNNCKHMAAVLYQVSETARKSYEEEQKKLFKDAIIKMTEEEAKVMLMMIGTEHAPIRHMILEIVAEAEPDFPNEIS